MVVGRLENLEVIPAARVVVGIAHGALADIALRNTSAEHAVDDRHCLGSGDGLVGAEGAVLIALYPAV